MNAVKKQTKQTSLFRVADALGTLKANIDPFNHQSSRSKANSALALEKFKASGFHIAQKDRIKAYLSKYPGSTLDEISWGTGIEQKGTICARFDDLRKEGWDMIDDHGRWSIGIWNIRKRKLE